MSLDKKEIVTCIKFVKKTLNLKSNVKNPSQYLTSLCDGLKLSNKNKIIAEKILEKTEKMRLHNGKNPIGLVTAAVYVSSIITNDPTTQRELSQTSGITQTTIRNRYKEIMKHVDIEVKI